MRFQLVLLLIVSFGIDVSPQAMVPVEGGHLCSTAIRDGSETQGQLEVAGFLIGMTEVTVAQWREFIDDTGLEFSWEGHFCGDISDLCPDDDCPIQLVRLFEAAAYCNWLSRRDHFQPVYEREGGRILRNPEANGYRLPTVAEWNFAARGGTASLDYPYAGSDDPDTIAWYGGAWEDGCRPVAIKQPNELGLYDMNGNAREWTWPEGGMTYPDKNPDEYVQVRGGSWVSKRETLRHESIQLVHPYTWNIIGFRLARNAE